MNEKYKKLKSIIESYGKAVIFFSGGVDSSLLLYAAKEVLCDNLLAITAIPEFVPMRERRDANELCSRLGVSHVTMEVDGLSIEGFKENTPERCYYCKKALFKKMMDIGESRGFNVYMEGSNLDDQGDYRPGLRALEELGIKSPLKEAGLTKSDIREISRELSLETWDKPSFACLASRFVYGEEITKEKLRMVELAEDFLVELGLKQFRVRIHGEDLARIEVLDEETEMETVLKSRKEIIRRLKEIGFKYISMDLEGYRMGSMNEVL